MSEPLNFTSKGRHEKLVRQILDVWYLPEHLSQISAMESIPCGFACIDRLTRVWPYYYFLYVLFFIRDNRKEKGIGIDEEEGRQ